MPSAEDEIKASAVIITVNFMLDGTWAKVLVQISNG
jgi:hypothetical protein